MRGLKLSSSAFFLLRSSVARSTRAWIETNAKAGFYWEAWSSHALRVRGLKRRPRRPIPPRLRSHALRVRGLKHCGDAGSGTAAVARSTRAWIETLESSDDAEGETGRTLYACVD